MNGAASIGYNIAAPTNGLLIAGQTGIGSTAPNAAALLDVYSTSKGFLPPRMTNAQEIAIGTNVSSGGLLVYNTTLNELDVYDSASGQWEAVGANAADAAGSTGQVQFNLNSNNDLGASANLFWNNASSYLGIGTTSPLSSLSVNGGAAIGSYAGTNSAGSGILIVSGNVGIGTTAPAQKLTVAGNGLLTGHVAIGNDAAVDQTLLPYGANNPVPSVLRTQDNVSGDLSVNEWMDSISDYSSYTHIGTAAASFYGYDAEHLYRPIRGILLEITFRQIMPVRGISLILREVTLCQIMPVRGISFTSQDCLLMLFTRVPAPSPMVMEFIPAPQKSAAPRTSQKIPVSILTSLMLQAGARLPPTTASILLTRPVAAPKPIISILPAHLPSIILRASSGSGRRRQAHP